MSVVRPEQGRIPECHNTGCSYCCCSFQQGNFIALYPGELAEAQRNGYSIAHLQVIDDDYFGGKRAKCTASDTASCDNGYKPLDCASYPLFPKQLQPTNEVRTFLKGLKCPLTYEQLTSHRAWVSSVWSELIAASPSVGSWVSHVSMIGYELECHLACGEKQCEEINTGLNILH